MPTDATLRMLKKYEEKAEPVPFLLSLCQAPEENFHDSQKVTIDTVRGEPRIAVANAAGSFGTRKVELTKAVNTEYTPLVYDLETTIGAYNALKRRPGVDPFDPEAGLLKDILGESFRYVRELDSMLTRGMELQAAQVLTTGIILSVDSAGTTMDSVDFSLRAAHLVTTGTAWGADGTTGDPGGDIEAIAEVIERNGKQEVDQVIAGRGAMLRLLANTKIRSGLDLLNMSNGRIDIPTKRGGAKYHGRVTLGTTRVVDLWSYRATYIHPQTGAHTPYIADNKVIVRSSQGRIDATYGSIPTIVRPDARVLEFLPPRMSNPERKFDASLNAWVTPDGKHLNLSAGTRGLVVPTAKDTFGCLTVY